MTQVTETKTRFTGKLLPYQVPAVERMVERGKVLVAYEMGLGKTVITIAAIEELASRGAIQSGLVVATSSLKYQWQDQLKVFAPDAHTLVIDGNPRQRAAQYEAANSGRFRYIILNYEQIVNDWKQVRTLPRDYIVCDEVTAIKSFASQRSKKVKRLQANYLFGLTGQPIENRAEELYSIMQWIDPEVLGRFDIFDNTFLVRNGYGRVIKCKNLPTLHKRMTEAMVRKTRFDPDVAPYMPAVVTETIPVQFDAQSARLYKRIVKELQGDLADALQLGHSFDLFAHYQGKSDSHENQLRGKIMAKLTCLRMLCDTPNLLRASAERFAEDEGGSAYAYELLQSGALDAAFTSPKVTATVDLIHDILDANERNKVVVFSFFRGVLNILDTALPGRCVQFHGGMSATEKATNKNQFQSDPATRVFLSSDAGGYGVDLPQANYLINFDLPWSAGKLDQRNARIIRASSEFGSVNLVNLVIKGSVEERQLRMLNEKRAIATAIIDGRGHDDRGRLTLDLQSLSAFLEDNDV